MKFVKFLLTLLATSIVFGITDEEQEELELGCLDNLKKRKSCVNLLENVTESNISERCKIFEDDYCYMLFHNPNKLYAYYENCKKATENSKEFKDLIESQLDLVATSGRLLCLKNYDSSMCPATQIFMNNITDEKKIKNILDSNCNSTKCTTVYYEYLVQVQKNMFSDDNEKAMANKYINYILSDECKSKNKKETERCGPYTGYGSCLEGCCSQYGFCGESPDHCFMGCQTHFSTHCYVAANSISTEPGRCGPDFGRCINPGECCNQDGYCGTTDDHCGNGCSRGYGVCSRVKKSKPNDGTMCGEDMGRCLNPEHCCSQYGYCGVTEAHCGAGCQSEFGVCNEKNILVSKVNGRCGPDYGKCANSNQCCSKYGYCGTTSDHCGAGCQDDYGSCSLSQKTSNTTSAINTNSNTANATKTSSTTSAAKTTTTSTTLSATVSTTFDEIPVSMASGRCGPEFGKCPKSNQCCSKYNYCGTSTDHCNYGCQPKYGICN